MMTEKELAAEVDRRREKRGQALRSNDIRDYENWLREKMDIEQEQKKCT